MKPSPQTADAHPFVQSSLFDMLASSHCSGLWIRPSPQLGGAHVADIASSTQRPSHSPKLSIDTLSMPHATSSSPRQKRCVGERITHSGTMGEQMPFRWSQFAESAHV